MINIVHGAAIDESESPESLQRLGFRLHERNCSREELLGNAVSLAEQHWILLSSEFAART
jgi:hypothetical protein